MASTTNHIYTTQQNDNENHSQTITTHTGQFQFTEIDKLKIHVARLQTEVVRLSRFVEKLLAEKGM